MHLHRIRTTSLLSIISLALGGHALNNGIARTPPMGFNAYQVIGGMCAQQYIQVGDAFVLSGMQAAGYSYVNSDAGTFSGRNADHTPKLIGSLYPNGLKAVMDSLHARGLKGGVYMFPGNMGATETNGYLAIDGKYLGDQSVDFLKYDGWGGSATPAMFTQMRDALLSTGRPILYSINGNGGADLANMWRISGDISPPWGAWATIAAYLGGDPSSAPGGWRDPDMMQVGMMGDSLENEKLHFSLWCATSGRIKTSDRSPTVTRRTCPSTGAPSSRS